MAVAKRTVEFTFVGDQDWIDRVIPLALADGAHKLGYQQVRELHVRTIEGPQGQWDRPGIGAVVAGADE